LLAYRLWYTTPVLSVARMKPTGVPSEVAEGMHVPSLYAVAPVGLALQVASAVPYPTEYTKPVVTLTAVGLAVGLALWYAQVRTDTSPAVVVAAHALAVHALAAGLMKKYLGVPVHDDPV
jgi:hypothetical protein